MGIIAPSSTTATVAVKRPAGSSKQVTRLLLYLLLVTSDLLSIFAAFTVAGMLRGQEWLSPNGVRLAVVMMPIYAAIAFQSNAYSVQGLREYHESVRRALAALAVTTAAILLLAFADRAGVLVSRLAFLSAVSISAALITVGRYIVHRAALHQLGEVMIDEVLIVDGVETPAQTDAQRIDAAAEGLRPDLRDPAMLATISARLAGADRVVIACPLERRSAWSLVCKGLNITGEIMLSDNQIGAIGIGRFGEQDTAIVSRGPLSLSNRLKKRVMDLSIAGLLLFALAPLLLITAVLVKLESPGPIFFRQPRIGRGNRMFEILKFRSMRAERCDMHGQLSTQRDDDRITRVGAFLRRTSIDELPQLINVIKGEMSLVGPRPHALGSLAGDNLFWEVTERYWLRHALKPGITGLAQVRGFRGATVLRTDLENRLQADLEYINDWRLWRDFAILARTFRVMIHEKAY